MNVIQVLLASKAGLVWLEIRATLGSLELLVQMDLGLLALLELLEYLVLSDLKEILDHLGLTEHLELLEFLGQVSRVSFRPDFIFISIHLYMFINHEGKSAK